MRAVDYQFVSTGVCPGRTPTCRSAPFFQSGLTTNYSGYSNPDVDALMAQSRVTDDNDVRAELYHDVFAQVAEDLPGPRLWHTAYGWVVRPGPWRASSSTRTGSSATTASGEQSDAGRSTGRTFAPEEASRWPPA